MGFSLREIGPLKTFAEGPPSKEQAIEFLEARLAVIREKIASLREVEEFIRRKLEGYQKPRVSVESSPGCNINDCS